MKLVRLFLFAVLGVIGAWIGRLIAHSKVPLPEGRWREIDVTELGRAP